MNARKRLVDTCTAPKFKGALIAAPFWIGITLLFQHTEVMSFTWYLVVSIACIAALTGLTIWYVRQLTPKEPHHVRSHPGPS